MATMASSKLTNLAELIVINEFDSRKKQGVRNNSSFVWQHFGALYRRSTAASSDESEVVDNEKWYCRYSTN